MAVVTSVTIGNIAYDISDEKTLANLAKIEETSTASKAYSVDDYLIFDGYLCRVTAAIAQGGTIILDTNVVKTTITDEFGGIEALGTKLESTVSGNTVTFTSDLIGSDSVPDGPYIKDVLTGLQGVAYNGTTITYTLTDTSADGKEAYLWIRN